MVCYIKKILREKYNLKHENKMCLFIWYFFIFYLQQKRIINDEKDIENLGDGIDAKEKIEKILEKLAKVIEIMRIRIKSM